MGSAPSSSYKLTYFDAPARAEPIRMIFKLARVPFIDERINFEDWPALKNSTPTGCLPVLEDSRGKKFTETMAILRHLAREYNLAGKNLPEKFDVDWVMDLYVTFFTGCLPSMLSEDKNESAKLLKQHIDDKGGEIIKQIEGVLKGNNLVAASGPTVADVLVLYICGIINEKLPDSQEKFPLLCKSADTLLQRSPDLKKYATDKMCS